MGDLRQPIAALLLTALWLLWSPAEGIAKDISFEGATIHLIVGAAPGGSYDSYSRMLVPFLRRHIPGDPPIVVENMPAAGGLVAANYLYNIAPHDGFTIGMFNRGSILSAVVGDPHAKFKPEKIYWLGTASDFSDNVYLFVIHSNLPYKSVDELRSASRPISVGNSGSAPIQILKKVLGLNVNVIEGFGKSDLDLAFERGEIDGEGIAYSNLIARHPDWVAKKLIRPIIQFGRRERNPRFANVPTAREVARTDDERALVDLVDAPFLIAYPFGLPPGAPPDRARVLRHAFEAAFRDPAYAAQARREKLDNAPASGAEVQSTIARIAASKPAVIAKYRQIVGGNAR